MQEFFWTFVKFSLVGVLDLPFLDFIYLLPLSPSGELLENGFERSSVIANSELLFSSSLASTKSLSSLTIVGSGSNSKLKDFSSFKKFLPFYLKLSVPALLSTCKNFSCVAPSFLLFFFFYNFTFFPWQIWNFLFLTLFPSTDASVDIFFFPQISFSDLMACCFVSKEWLGNRNYLTNKTEN